LRVARRRRPERFYACGALERLRAARSTRTLDNIMVGYSLRFDDAYFIEAVRQHLARSKSRWLQWPIKTICALGLVALAALGVAAKTYAITAFALFFLALLFIGRRLDYMILRRRFRKHSEFGSEAQVELHNEHINFASSNYRADVKWPSFRNAVECPDGILLYRSPWDYLWFPDSSLSHGMPADARAIIKSQVSKYDVV